IRYICGVVHPSNEVLSSDILPRWAIIGWLLTTCTVRTRTHTHNRHTPHREHTHTHTHTHPYHLHSKNTHTHTLTHTLTHTHKRLLGAQIGGSALCRYQLKNELITTLAAAYGAIF